MKKILMLSALLGAIATPAFAEEQAMTCDSGTIAKMTTGLDAIVDPGLKEKVDAARAELAKANDALKANKTEDCLAALKQAVEKTPGHPTN